MGEANAKAAALAAMQAQLNAKKQVPLTAVQAMKAMLLDLACHGLMGVAVQLAQALGDQELANEVSKSVEHLQATKTRFLAAAQSRVVLAGAMPPPPPKG